MNFDKKQIVVTGAARGIGLAVVKQLLNSNATVIATDVNETLMEGELLSLQSFFKNQLNTYAFDLRDTQQINQHVKTIESQYGRIDALVSCAGILHLGALSELSLEHWQDTLTVNTTGVLYLIQAITQSMKENRKGNIVVIGSNACNTPRPNMGAYSASKSALHMLVKTYALELAQFGIRCNLVSPGSTRTNMQTQLWHENYGEKEVIQGDLSQYRLGIPLQKIAEPNDIAQTVLFLLSDAANHITMHDLRVDGGATLDA